MGKLRDCNGWNGENPTTLIMAADQIARSAPDDRAEMAEWVLARIGEIEALMADLRREVELESRD